MSVLKYRKESSTERRHIMCVRGGACVSHCFVFYISEIEEPKAVLLFVY